MFFWNSLAFSMIQQMLAIWIIPIINMDTITLPLPFELASFFFCLIALGTTLNTVFNGSRDGHHLCLVLMLQGNSNLPSQGVS